MVCTEKFSTQPQATQLIDAELGTNFWRKGKAGWWGEKMLCLLAGDCLARVGQAWRAGVGEYRRGVRMEAATWAAQLGGSAVLRLPASLPFQEASQSGACNSPPSRGGSGMWKLAQRAWLPPLLQSRTPGTRVHHVEKGGPTPRPGPPRPRQASEAGVGWGWCLDHPAGLSHSEVELLSSSPALGHGLWDWPHSLLGSALQDPQGGWELRPLSSQRCVYKK